MSVSLGLQLSGRHQEESRNRPDPTRGLRGLLPVTGSRLFAFVDFLGQYFRAFQAMPTSMPQNAVLFGDLPAQCEAGPPFLHELHAALALLSSVAKGRHLELSRIAGRAAEQEARYGPSLVNLDAMSTSPMTMPWCRVRKLRLVTTWTTRGILWPWECSAVTSRRWRCRCKRKGSVS